VYPWHCDHMGHMNVMWYVGKFDEASWQLISTLGLTQRRFREQGRAVATVEQRIDYKRELHAGDIITIRSAALEIKDKALKLVHEMRNDDTGEIAATMVTVGVHIDAATRRACSWPADVRARALTKINSTNIEESDLPSVRQNTSGYPTSGFNEEPVETQFALYT
jgi:acyl-CoA thioester hydrolase